ncbi:MAG: hypothetical protein LBF41_02960 [Deltaproteobacteria bacterium]|jgi:hypothetical protein|nr:hypothetical protein [Deltaproteobacteria bacterium]
MWREAQTEKSNFISFRFPVLAGALVLAAFALVSCGHRYEFRAIPVRDMNDYPGRASLGDVRVGAESFYDSKRLTELFGFDLKAAGVVPVQLLVQNDGSTPVTVGEGSTLRDRAGQVWEVLPSSVVYRRIDDYTSGALSGEEGAKRTALWGLAGGIIGAAAGVVSGGNVAESAGKGAAVGAAAGAASSVMGMGTTEDTSADVNRDFSGRSIDHATVEPGAEAHGFLYFPAEIKEPRSLNLKITRGGKTETLRLDL